MEGRSKARQTASASSLVFEMEAELSQCSAEIISSVLINPDHEKVLSTPASVDYSRVSRHLAGSSLSVCAGGD